MAVCKKCGGNFLEDLGMCEVCGSEEFVDSISDVVKEDIEENSGIAQKRMVELDENTEDISNDVGVTENFVPDDTFDAFKELSAIFSEIDFSPIEDEPDDLDEEGVRKIIANLNIRRHSSSKSKIKQEDKTENTSKEKKKKRIFKKKNKKKDNEKSDNSEDTTENSDSNNDKKLVKAGKRKLFSKKKVDVIDELDEKYSDKEDFDNEDIEKVENIISEDKPDTDLDVILDTTIEDELDDVLIKDNDELNYNEPLNDEDIVDETSELLSDLDKILSGENKLDGDELSVNDEENNFEIDDIIKDNVTDNTDETNIEQITINENDINEIDASNTDSSNVESFNKESQNASEITSEQDDKENDKDAVATSDKYNTDKIKINKQKIVAFFNSLKQKKDEIKDKKKKDNKEKKSDKTKEQLNEEYGEQYFTAFDKFIHKVFDNVEDKHYEEKLKRKENKEKQKLENKKQKVQLKKQQKEAKAEAKQNAKAVEKAKKDAQKKKRKLAMDRKRIADMQKAPRTRINKLGATVVFAFFGLIVFAVVSATDNISYRNSINNAQKYYDLGEYDKAYSEISGLELKESDEKLYEKLRIIQTLNIQLSYYNSYIIINKYPEALDILLKAVDTYNINYDDAKKCSIEGKYNKIYEQVLNELQQVYGLSEDDAKEISSINDSEKYSKRIHEICDQITDEN